MNISVDGLKSKSVLPYHLSAEFQAFMQEIRADKVALEHDGVFDPAPIIAKLKQHKFGALRLTTELGGQNLSIEQLFAVFMQLSRVDSNLTHIFHSHFQFVEEVLKHPNQAFKQLWLARIADGKIISNALSEPSQNNVGSGRYDTHLSLHNQAYDLNGEKAFTTGTLYADYVLVRAQSVEDQRVANVVVPTARQGVEIYDDWDGIGQRFTASGRTVFRQVVVQPDEILWFKPDALVHKPFAQLFIQAMIAGQTMAIEDAVSVLLKNRKRTFSYGSTEVAANEPLFLEKVGEISSINFIVEQAVLQAARSLDQVLLHIDDEPEYQRSLKQAALDTAKVKIAIDPLALHAADLMFEVVSASSMHRKLNLDQYWRNIRTLANHNPRSLKAKVVGDYVVNQQALPNISYF